MFKRLVLSLFFLAGLCGVGVPLLQAKAKVSPYYQLQFDIGQSVPSKGEMMTTSNLTNDLGIIFQPIDRHRFVGFYELKYTGPGLKKEEGDKFTDRTMDHIFVLKHHFAWKSDYILKSQIDYMKEYRRTGANEIWGQGLYDFNRTGFCLDINRKFNDKLSGDVYFQYHYIEFPNYTDILAEFQAGDSSESSTGKQNQHNYQLGAKTSYYKINASMDLCLVNYTKQKVVTDNVQENKTYYSGELQKDMNLTLALDCEKKIWNTITLNPTISLKNKTSNQNFQHFLVATDTVPVQYIGNYFSYNLLDVSCPISFALSKVWLAFITPELNYKLYLNRPPRDSSNTFLSGNQYNNLFLLSCGFTKQQNDVTAVTIFYAYQSQVSNMTFEKYLPYNYSGHFIGVSFSYTY